MKFSPLRAGIQKKLLAKRVEIGVVTLTLTLIVITCVLSVLLLLHANSVATKGYKLKLLRAEKHDLSLLHQRLQAEIAQKKSLATVLSTPLVMREFIASQDFVVIQSERKYVQK